MTDDDAIAPTPAADVLLALLPAVHRSRDEELGGPLRALLRVIEEQVDVVADDLDQWYDNWFVETCDPRLLPQLARLVGLSGDLPARRAVADAVADRRRKGVAAGLEDAATAASGWSARAVEAFPRLVRDQHLRYLTPARPATLDVRDELAAERLGGPFDDAPHRVDVRRPDSELAPGRHNIPDLTLFVWRLDSFPVTEAPAFCIDQRYSRYLIDVLGIDAPLFSPRPEVSRPAHRAGPADVPHPVGRLELAHHRDDYYGPGLALMIWRDADRVPVPSDSIVAADLTDWVYRPEPGQVAVDPQLGRIAFAPEEAPEDGVWVSWHYGFSAPMGGGEYRRGVTPVGRRRHYLVGPGEHGSIGAALAAWGRDKAEARDAGRQVPHAALIEITDSADYTEPLRLDLERHDRLELRAAVGARPVIRLLNQRANRFDALLVRAVDRQPPPGDVTDCPPPAAARPVVVLDGLVVTGRSVDVVGQVGELVLRHCTLVPGWTLDHDGRPRHGQEPSIELRRTTARLTAEHSILGTVVVEQDETAADPTCVRISDSIVDATADDLPAIAGPDGRYAYSDLVLRRCTVFGDVAVHRAALVEDSVLTGCLSSARPAAGCVRRTVARPGAGPFPAGSAPVFTSTRYGTPGYAQLGPLCPPAVSRGAGDGSELGAFHDLFQPQRFAALDRLLQEYVTVGVDAAVVPVT
ncbi:MAG TPA: hypothetical protein VI248_17085 [Kineosporiaceae bacterium]